LLSLLLFFSLLPPPPTPTLFPYTTLFRSHLPEMRFVTVTVFGREGHAQLFAFGRHRDAGIFGLQRRDLLLQRREHIGFQAGLVRGDLDSVLLRLANLNARLRTFEPRDVRVADAFRRFVIPDHVELRMHSA